MHTWLYFMCVWPRKLQILIMTVTDSSINSGRFRQVWVGGVSGMDPHHVLNRCKATCFVLVYGGESRKEWYCVRSCVLGGPSQLFYQ